MKFKKPAGLEKWDMKRGGEAIAHHHQFCSQLP